MEPRPDRTARAATRARVLALACLLLSASACAPLELLRLGAPGSVRVTLTDGAPAPAVVYLKRLRQGRKFPGWARSDRVRHRNGELEPALLIVLRGERVQFSNEDAIYHRPFSYSAANGFDLGPLAQGETRTLRLEHDGVVHVYCSLHPEEHGVIFVAPSRHVRAVAAPGTYELAGVPPGDYELHVWSEEGSAPGRPLTLRPGQRLDVETGIEPGQTPER